MEPKTNPEDLPDQPILVSLGVRLYRSISGFITKAEI